MADTEDADPDPAADPVADLYDRAYYASRLQAPWYWEARAIAREVYRQFEPDSVIDVGCAVGVYLQYLAEETEVGTVRGVDGHPAALDLSPLARQQLEQHDLREPYDPPDGREYDLVLCIEVAEHLPADAADTLVASLGRCGPTVLFTAGQPGQDGTHHVNCRERGYWLDLFGDAGYRHDDAAVDDLRRSIIPTRLDWIPRNLFVFRRRGDR